jgi:hypothetical protein
MLTSFSLISCEQPKVTNDSLDMPENVRENLDREINKYNDDVVSKIIELRDYKFRKANIFCTHSNVEIKKSDFLPNHINVISRLYCAEPLKEKPKKDGEGTILDSYSGLTNLSDIPIKYTISLSKQNKPSILGFQLPRNAPFYEYDFKLYFNEDERNKIRDYTPNNVETNRRLKEKIRQNS